jgi:hypothetical protein
MSFQTPEDWIRQFLAPGRRKAGAVYAAAAKKGYTPTQIRIARPGVATQSRDGNTGIWYWELLK